MTLFVWVGFLVFILAMVALDLGVFHRTAHRITIREALLWTAAWVVLALCFNVFVYFLYEQNWLGWTESHAHHLSGRDAAVQFFIGYLIEKSLSLDNIFVIAMILTYFHIPHSQQHRVLFWGILGAVVMRGVLIALGAALIARFWWATYVFGALLIASAIKMLLIKTDELHPERNIVYRLARRVFPVTSRIEGGRFFLKIDGRWAATPLFLALLLVETADVMFAVDSIPAIFAVTRDPFLVFTSNIFAILGLRSLYFAVAGLMHKFETLKTALVFVLAYVGIKILLEHHYPIPNVVSLAVIAGTLSLGVLVSIIRRPRQGLPHEGPPGENHDPTAADTPYTADSR
jgi:tellurite resistance protein TerC